MCVLLQLLYYILSRLYVISIQSVISLYTFFLVLNFATLICVLSINVKLYLKKKKKKNAAKAACLSDLGDRLVTRGDWVQVPL